MEKIQKFSDRPLTTCPHCKGHLKKLLSAPAIQFKGSGWYVTDYGKSGSSSRAGESKGDKPAKEEKKADKEPSSKPEKKKE